MSPPLRLEFVTSAARVDDLPPSRAEVAVVGRSNVGKSSLLNALANQRHLARTSKTPGRTQLLNCFSVVGAEATVVDCPGYGYATVSKAERAAWARMVDRYLLEREPLTMVMALVDGEVGPTKVDLEILAWLREHAVPHSVVATKADKVRPSKLGARRRDLAAGCMLDPDDVVWVSATKGTGIERLRGLVHLWLS